MKQFLISISVSILIIRVDSSAVMKLDDTIPQTDSFPAFLLRRWTPAVPKDVEEDPDTKEMMFHFETIDKKFDVLETVTHSKPSYYCPNGGNELELVSSKEAQCKNQLRVAVIATGSKCGNDNRDEYNIGYGIHNHSSFGNLFHSAETEVQYPLYMSCFDEVEDRVYVVKFEFKGRNNLYYRSSTIYPPAVLEDISKFHEKIAKEMTEKLKGIQKLRTDEETDKKPKDLTNLIPFQLISHEDMILYNLKLTTFNKKNYSFIWKNIAENSWKSINEYFRNFMKECNPDIEVYSGVHDFTKYGYPRYIYKHIHHKRKGMFVIVHNHPSDDEEDYPHLCPNYDNCEGYAFLPNQKNKNLGLFYCCPTKSVKDEIIFFKGKSRDFDTLLLKDLKSIDDTAHPESFEHVIPKPKPVNEKADSSTESSSSSSSNTHGPDSAVNAKNIRRPEVPKAPIPNVTEANQPATLKSESNSATDDAVAMLQKRLGWTPPPSIPVGRKST